MSTALMRPDEVEDQLALLARARQWLAQARTLEEVLQFRDQVEAVRHYRQVSGQAVEACNEAAEMKLRAERKLGELLAGMPKRQGTLLRGDTLSQRDDQPPTLASLGIQRKQSQRWQKVAALPQDDFEQHVRDTRAAGEQLTTAGVLRLVKLQDKARQQQEVRRRAEAAGSSGLVGDLHALVADGKRYGCVYLDPPWPYQNQGTRAATANHYATMTLEEIAALPVGELAAEESHLWLWTTNAFLEAALGLLRGWGFEFKSTFVWCKEELGLGNYLRCSHETLLFGLRGDCPFLARDIRSWVVYPRGRHSAKPDEVRTLVERASPGPRIELFGRKQVAGWDVWGNEAAFAAEG